MSWDKSVHEKEERELKQLSRHRKIQTFVRWSIRSLELELELDTGSKSVKEVKMPANIRTMINWHYTCRNKIDSTISPKHLATTQEIQKPDAFEKPHGKGVNWKAFTGRKLKQCSSRYQQIMGASIDWTWTPWSCLQNHDNMNHTLPGWVSR